MTASPRGRDVPRAQVPVRVRVGHPLLAHDRLELAALDHAARRLEVVEDRLEAREALEAHHLFGEQRAVVAMHDVPLPGQVTESLVERHEWRISARGSARRSRSWDGRHGACAPLRRCRVPPRHAASSATCTRRGPTCRSRAGSGRCWSRRAGPSRTGSASAAGSRATSTRRRSSCSGSRTSARGSRRRCVRSREQLGEAARRRRCRRRRSRRSARLRRALRRTAAIPTAPLGSITSFSRSNAKRIASTICSSVTVTISSTSREPTSHVSRPGSFVCRPSAIVRGTSIAHALALRERLTPVVAGRRLDADDAPHPESLAIVALPAIRPPPPTGVDERVDDCPRPRAARAPPCRRRPS